MNVRAWIDFLVALLEKPAIVVAGVAQVLHEPLQSRIASESESVGCCEHLVTFEYVLSTNLAVLACYDKFCCLMLLLHVLHHVLHQLQIL